MLYVYVICSTNESFNTNLEYIALYSVLMKNKK